MIYFLGKKNKKCDASEYPLHQEYKKKHIFNIPLDTENPSNIGYSTTPISWKEIPRISVDPTHHDNITYALSSLKIQLKQWSKKIY